MRCSVGHRLAVAVPSMIVAVPLAGFAFQLDQRKAVYRSAADGLVNPLLAARHAADGIDEFLSRGNFRPLGRFLEAISDGFVFEAAEATGISPNVVHGVLRIAVVGLLALVATQVLCAILRSARRTPSGHPVVVLYPLVLAMTLVAGDADGALIFYPFTIVGTSILVLAIALLVARDSAMTDRPVRRREALAMLLLGAIAVVTYDLAYIAAPLAAALIITRGAAAGMPAREALHTAATRRLMFLAIGFAIAFVPVRIVVAQRCSEADCNAASDLYLSGNIIPQAVDRVATGMPPAGWSHVAELARRGDRYGFGMADLAANALLMALVIVIALIAVATGRRASRLRPSTEERTTDWPRLAASLGLFGLALAVLPALLVSMSRYMHAMDYAVGEAWRDTVLVQTGWSLMITAVLVVVTEAIRSAGGRRIATWAVAAVLAAGCTATLLANQQLNEIDQETSLSAINNQIATATIHFDRGGSGNANRCNLLEAFAGIRGRSNWEEETRQFRAALDTLMLERHGEPFCAPVPTTQQGA